MTGSPSTRLLLASTDTGPVSGFARWLDTLARPPRRLPEDAGAALAYVSNAVDQTVFAEWTPRTLVQRCGSPEEAKRRLPVVFQLLLRHDRVVQYWSAGQLLTVPAPDAPPRESVLNGLLRALPRFRRVNTPPPGTAGIARERDSPASVAPASIEAGPWLARVGRYFNADTSSNTLGVVDDRAAVQAFLRERTNRSPHTRRMYVQEIRRLIAWARAAGLGPLSDLSREALLAYRDALPQVRSLAHADDAGPLSTQSVRLALAVVKSLFSYWAQTGYLRVNPASALGTIRPERSSLAPERFLPAPALAASDRWLAALVSGPASCGALRRAAIFALYRYAGVRVAELAASGNTGLPRVNVQSADWTLEIMGKGGRRRQVPLPACCVTVLQRYRLARGLPGMPSPLENAPLIDAKRGAGLGPSGLYREVKAALIQIARASTGEDSGSIAALHRASPHWLRHGYARAMVVEHGVPLPVAQGLLGHASVTTTAGYATPDLSEARRFVIQTFDAAGGANQDVA
ncbi:tyrosine-type recombinase/integrase [Paraburkholderia youngii]|uniref:tyrosine-type recombinase/integrase n=1 Tax=Paraburkholderia youngii TaxID=2782701 RepID=UPI001591D6A7|nr:tyrosine-type recombinase/integrase [Paraburkholderia youngii]NUX57666.1 tyrosine-type recombinase/integrase [Paraburkholderia youngii]